MSRSKPRDALAVMAHRLAPIDDPDFFPTPPWGARAGAEWIRRLDPGARSVWEPACGAGHMAHGLGDYFPQVFQSDAFVYGPHTVYDFTDRSRRTPFVADWIVTNPPFALIGEFIRLAWARARRGVAMLMRLGVKEGVTRHPLLARECPLAATMTFAERLPMHKLRWEPDGSTAAAYAWFFWLKPPALGASPYRAAILAARQHGLHLDGWIEPGARRRLSRPSDLVLAAKGGA